MRTNKQIPLVFLLLIASFSFSLAQDSLSLQGVIELALKQNHGIQVSRNDAIIAGNSATIGNAGLLPSVGVNAGISTSLTDTRVEFANPEVDPIDQNGAGSSANNASLELNYTLFDGFGTFNAYQSLKEQGMLAGVQSRVVIENTIMQVITAYYNVANQQDALAIAKETMSLSRERLQRSQLNYEYGSSSKVELLASEVDLNNDSITLVNAQLNLEQAQRELAFLTGQSLDVLQAVSSTVVYNPDLDAATMQQTARENNASLLAASHQLSLADLGLKTARAPRYPTIGLNASYGLNEQRNDAGFTTFTRNQGFTGGITLSYNIFNGGQANTNLKNARIRLESSQESLAEAKSFVDKEVANGYAAFQNRIAVLQLAKSNLPTAALNFDRTRDAYELGQATGTQYREAQLNLAQTRLNIKSAQYATKMAEMELLRLAGKLLTP